jgi:hypothetical protein
MRRRCCKVDVCELPPSIPEDCAALLSCLVGMLSVIHVEFADVGSCPWSRLSGDYQFFDGGGHCRRFNNVGDGCDWQTEWGCAEGDDEDFTIQFCPYWEFDCVEDEETPGLYNLIIRVKYRGGQIGRDEDDDEDGKDESNDDGDCFGSLLAEGIFPLPIAITNGVEFTLTPQTGDGPDCSAASVTFYGPPCGEPDACEGGPTASFTASNIGLRLDICDPDEVDEVEFNTGCTYTITPTITAGDCPILICLWSNGAIGCDPGPITIYRGCGTSRGYDLTLTVIDERGCKATYTQTLNCCACCEPEGAYTLEEDTIHEDFCDYDPGAPPCGETTGCTIPIGADGLDPCGVHNNQYCFWKLTLAGTVTDCGDVFPNLIRYLINWDGLEDRFGVPLPDGCYSGGDVIRIRHNVGALGSCHCVELVAFDDLGCMTAPEYISDPFRHIYCYDEPQTDVECAPGILIEDQPTYVVKICPPEP